MIFYLGRVYKVYDAVFNTKTMKRCLKDKCFQLQIIDLCFDSVNEIFKLNLNKNIGEYYVVNDKYYGPFGWDIYGNPIKNGDLNAQIDVDPFDENITSVDLMTTKSIIDKIGSKSDDELLNLNINIKNDSSKKIIIEEVNKKHDIVIIVPEYKIKRMDKIVNMVVYLPFVVIFIYN